ncbi:secretin and TonB N-terminal domain-containing protein [Candidatus Saganbacteria bacterium]|nr:secretin and TonB N-terminal domain-containing protein [Candidatus Saganbacteria bacterium]
MSKRFCVVKFVSLFLFFSAIVGLSSSVCAAEIIDRLDFNDAPALAVIQMLGRKANINVVVAGNSSNTQDKRISLSLNRITAEQALEQVLKTSGLVYERRDNVLLISFSPLPPDDAGFPGETAAINLQYLPAQKVVDLLNKLWPALKTSSGGGENIIVIVGKENLLAEARQLIAVIDRPAPQVLIESQVMEITESDALKLGLSYGAEAGSFKFITNKETKRTSPAAELMTTLNALLGNGQAKIVATPRIATLAGHEATINIGNRVPFAVPVSSSGNNQQWKVDYIDAGVKLKITPFLGEAGEVTADIQPEVSSISEWRVTPAGEFPVISTRNAQATLRVKNGETIVVGGLLSESKRENITAVPVLGQIPLINLLFQNKTTEKAKTEIVFLITPHII